MLVETPFQLLCAHEYMLTHDATYKICIRTSNRQVNDRQLVSMAAGMGIAIDRVICCSPGRGLSSVAAVLKFLIPFFGRYDKVLLGSYFSGLLQSFVRIVIKDQVILLDDGVATLLADRLIAASDRAGKAYAIFTVFELPHATYSTYERHSLTASKNEMALKLSLVDVNQKKPTAIFIGQKMVEIAALDTEAYLRVIKQAAEICDGRELFYIPHRDELEGNLEKVASLKGVTILRSDGAIEYLFMKNGWSPEYIFSIVSTALITIASLYPHAKSYALIPSELRREMFPHWDLVNECLIKHGRITVLDNAA